MEKENKYENIQNELVLGKEVLLDCINFLQGCLEIEKEKQASLGTSYDPTMENEVKQVLVSYQIINQNFRSTDPGYLVDKYNEVLKDLKKRFDVISDYYKDEIH